MGDSFLLPEAGDITSSSLPLGSLFVEVMKYLATLCRALPDQTADCIVKVFKLSKIKTHQRGKYISLKLVKQWQIKKGFTWNPFFCKVWKNLSYLSLSLPSITSYSASTSPSPLSFFVLSFPSASVVSGPGEGGVSPG